MTWKDALEGFWMEKRRGLSPNTVKGYSGVFRRFAAFVGEDKPLEGITASHVRGFLNEMAERDNAEKTILNAWITLSSFWSWAERELGTPHVIRGRVARPKWHRPQVEPYTEAQVSSMLQMCEWNAPWQTGTGRWTKSKRPSAMRDRAIVLTLVDTGLRSQELCNLTMADYDRVNGRIRVLRGKGNKMRFVWAGENTRKAIWRYLVQRGATEATAPLFAGLAGKRLNRDNLRRMIQTFAKRAEIGGATVHRFRHTFAIWFLRNGGNVLALQDLLGHERLETVRIYAKLAEVDLQTAQRRASPADHWKL